MDGKLTCYGYGEDERAINPGDLLIVGKQWMRENSKLIETEFCLSLRGRDISYFVEHAMHAKGLWDDNKNWLSAPSSQPGVDMRPMSEIRSSSNLAAVKSFYNHNR